jgi:hypothetical protein
MNPISTLHGILAELGIEPPSMHPERDATHAPEWTVNEKFMPTPGKTYELAFGKIHFAGEHKHVIKRVRITGPTPDDWIDLDEAKPLDKALQAHEVKAFRPIE